MRFIRVLHASTFCYFFAVGLVIPVLPIYLAQVHGVAPVWVGWAVALMPLAGILLRPWSGWLSDGWSRKWPTLLGLAISGLAGLLYLGGLPLVLLARAFQGLGIALYAPTSLAVTSDLAPGEKLTDIMSTRNLLVGVGLMAGSAVGGALEELAGFVAVFALMALVQLLFLPFLLRLPETLVAPGREAWWRGYTAGLRLRPVLAATLGNMGFAAIFSAVQAYYPLILSGAGFSTGLVGAFFGFYSLISVLFRVPVGPLSRRFTADRVVLWGFMLSLLGLLVLWWRPLPPLAFLAAGLLGAGSGFYLPANLVSVSRAAPAAIRGSVFSLYTLSWDVGGVVGPGLGSAVSVLVGTVAVLPLVALLALLVIAGYVRLVGRRVLLPARAPLR